MLGMTNNDIASVHQN